MLRSLSLSSDSSLPSLDDDVDSECSDELQGSQSRRWLADLLTGGLGGGANAPNTTLGLDGLYSDPHFPVGELELQDDVRWLRPKEICSSAQFIVDGATRLDVVQGQLNDCWLLSAMASLSLHPSLLEKVVPLQQNFDDRYDGSFTFRFWQYGQWEEVKIDDLLPTIKGRLLYLTSSNQNEFWSPLLEKAYAKLKGGYRALNMGFPHEAMVDLSGGVTEVLKVSSLPRDLLPFLRRLLHRGALINTANCQGGLEERHELGIMYRHAYSLTAVEEVQTSKGPKQLVRVLNPWGNTEWEGRWSDMQGPEWQSVSEEEQQRLGRVRREDGEFWMCVSDFRQYFQVMEVCYLTDSLRGGAWSCCSHHGNWVPRVSAGGPPNSGQFWMNPQFLLVLSEVDDDVSEPQKKKRCTFVLALMQKYQRRRGVSLETALHVYQAPPSSQASFLSPDDLSRLRPLRSSGQYSCRREVVLRSSLPIGRYIIVPSTSQSDQEGAFLLRVLTQRGNQSSPSQRPPPQDSSERQLSFPHQAALPPLKNIKQLYRKHCNKKGQCKPHHLFNLLTEALQGGVLCGCEKNLELEHCKSLIILMDTQGVSRLSWSEFQSLWDKIRRWTDIFLAFDRNKTRRLEYKEVGPALKAAGLHVDQFVLQLVGLRYTEPDLTVSFPGFLFLLMKMEAMIRKFQAFDMMRAGVITLTYRQWLQLTMYN